MISAKEVQRLSKTKWQIELDIIENLIKESLYKCKSYINYKNTLCEDTIDYLNNLGYIVKRRRNNLFRIYWE